MALELRGTWGLARSPLNVAKGDYGVSVYPHVRGKPSSEIDPIHDAQVLHALSAALFDLLRTQEDGALVVVKNIATYPALYAVALAFDVAHRVTQDNGVEHAAIVSRLNSLAAAALELAQSRPSEDRQRAFCYMHLWSLWRGWLGRPALK